MRTQPFRVKGEDRICGCAIYGLLREIWCNQRALVEVVGRCCERQKATGQNVGIIECKIINQGQRPESNAWVSLASRPSVTPRRQEVEELQGESSVPPQEDIETRVVTRGEQQPRVSQPVEVYDLVTARQLAERLFRCFQRGGWRRRKCDSERRTEGFATATWS